VPRGPAIGCALLLLSAPCPSAPALTPPPRLACACPPCPRCDGLALASPGSCLTSTCGKSRRPTHMSSSNGWSGKSRPCQEIALRVIEESWLDRCEDPLRYLSYLAPCLPEPSLVSCQWQACSVLDVPPPIPRSLHLDVVEGARSSSVRIHCFCLKEGCAWWPCCCILVPFLSCSPASSPAPPPPSRDALVSWRVSLVQAVCIRCPLQLLLPALCPAIQ
jgi:hypothetical protein